MDPAARAMKVTANPARTVITITGPTEIEVPDWNSAIKNGIAKYGS